jgi:biopolymer transport protein ExbD
VNKEPLTKATLPARLKEIYDGRPEKIIFVKGDPKVKYSEVIYAMDVSRGSGVRVIGMSPKETPEGAPQ